MRGDADFSSAIENADRDFRHSPADVRND